MQLFIKIFKLKLRIIIVKINLKSFKTRVTNILSVSRLETSWACYKLCNCPEAKSLCLMTLHQPSYFGEGNPSTTGRRIILLYLTYNSN